jgi:predicted acylesterase/phospholipase RssA
MPPRLVKPRTAFVLAGGAALGAMQVGMLRALYERGIAPTFSSGRLPERSMPLSSPLARRR